MFITDPFNLTGVYGDKRTLGGSPWSVWMAAVPLISEKGEGLETESITEN